MTEEERKVQEKNHEEKAKANGSWFYECKDIFLTKIVLKRHMHNDHNIEIQLDIVMMFHGVW